MHSNVLTPRVVRFIVYMSYLATELSLEGLLSPENLAAEVGHDFHEMSAKVEKCDGAEAVTARLQDIGMPQVKNRLPQTELLLQDQAPRIIITTPTVITNGQQRSRLMANKR